MRRRPNLRPKTSIPRRNRPTTAAKLDCRRRGRKTGHCRSAPGHRRRLRNDDRLLLPAPKIETKSARRRWRTGNVAAIEHALWPQANSFRDARPPARRRRWVRRDDARHAIVTCESAADYISIISGEDCCRCDTASKPHFDRAPHLTSRCVSSPARIFPREVGASRWR